jgi:hypothetical protein
VWQIALGLLLIVLYHYYPATSVSVTEMSVLAVCLKKDKKDKKDIEYEADIPFLLRLVSVSYTSA